ncbi:MAG: F510_1955 family glycosylhydrolase [Ardenticatenaceae bacterium]
MTRSTGTKRRTSSRKQQRATNSLLIVVAVVALLVVAGWYILAQRDGDGEAAHKHSPAAAAVAHVHGQEVELPHIHGMGYSDDGEQLVVAAHDGLRVFVGGEWLIPDVPGNDYMGFSPMDEGFYSSGHPGPDSGLTNPLGLVKSTDAGRTLTTLGFEGESDFHLMGVGYDNHAIYVLNPTPNSRLGIGLYYSLDDGATWQQSTLQGRNAQPIQLTVHPDEPNIVGLATEGGLLLSEDYGNQFDLTSERRPMTAATFLPSGEELLFGYQTLQAFELATGEVRTLGSPELGANDGIAFLAVNPARPDEIALATFERDIYLSQDGGASWQPIAQDGKGL